MRYDIKEKLPAIGEVVMIYGIVRYGRKKQKMAAKRMVFSCYPCLDEYIVWVALKNGSAYTDTINIQSVFSWEYI